ncbi:MAG: biopolymer transporter ExbD [Nitrospirae bacterium]|nr:biopolymer transporter ExbD [Nitrospirota bacterium]
MLRKSLIPDTEEENLLTGINIIPLVDISLVLLIIFMVTTSFLIPPILRLNLPKGQTAQAAPLSPIVITVEKDGRLFLNKQSVTEQTLALLFKEDAQKDPDMQVFIQADTRSEYGKIVTLIDLARQNGLTRFGLMMEKEKP